MLEGAQLSLERLQRTGALEQFPHRLPVWEIGMLGQISRLQPIGLPAQPVLERQMSTQQLEQGRFSGPVSPQQRHFFPPAKAKVQVRKVQFPSSVKSVLEAEQGSLNGGGRLHRRSLGGQALEGM